MYSCDTMVATGRATASGQMMVAKNSDRPRGEAQPLYWQPAATHGPDDTLACTYITIPQVPHTYAVTGSKPAWMWGFEFGANEHGLVIANEAVWSKEPVERKNGLIGMDLLRLGLERAKTAREALDVITSLLEQYGQGGKCWQHGSHRYHNLFLLADGQEAIVLETSRRRWIAKRVEDVWALSNCYSIETEWDWASGDIVEHAVRNGWAGADGRFNFAKVYGLSDHRLHNALARQRRALKLLQLAHGRIDDTVLRSILRDHFEGELIAPRTSPADALYVTICMHGNPASVTAAGAVFTLGKTLGWQHCFGTPCCGMFRPVFFGKPLPPSWTDETGAWLQWTGLRDHIEADYETLHPRFAQERDTAEQDALCTSTHDDALRIEKRFMAECNNIQQ